ncbi:MAG TPA: hypothetical protein VG872_12020 [Acidimicrobiia bacterium]|jgi:hypothetical protein|nr:hypothetical protein [Acidimicrobiia bacterium]
MEKAKHEGRLTLSTPSAQGDGVVVTLDYQGSHGPTDALLAEISFILAETEGEETRGFVD